MGETNGWQQQQQQCTFVWSSVVVQRLALLTLQDALLIGRVGSPDRVCSTLASLAMDS